MASNTTLRSASVVLVHGAAHGAWCWDRVVSGLTVAGITVHAVDLPGHGQDTRALTDLHGNAASVNAMLDTIEGPVVLVGHSLGGAVITEAGVHPNVVQLVYIAAMALDSDETSGAAAARGPQFDDQTVTGVPTLRSGFRISPDGASITMDPTVAAQVFYSDCTNDDIAWAVGRLGPELLATFAQAPAHVAWRTTPSTFAVCMADKTVHPDLQRTFAARCGQTVEWACGHSPFLSHPESVVDLISELAKQTSAPAGD
jgi:pimeloyl-ACP methyl ester carboxylesterase